MQEIVNRANELLESGEVARVLGWKKGDLSYNPEPAYFYTVEDLKNLFITDSVVQTLVNT